jgi:hypothetical protein
LLAVCQLCCGLAEAGMLARAVIAKASANVILLIMLFSVFACSVSRWQLTSSECLRR